MAQEWKYTGIDPELARGLNERAAEGGRGGVRIEGRSPPGATTLKIAGLSANGRQVIAAAGYRTADALIRFDIDHLDEVLGADDLDPVAKASIKAEYDRVKRMPAKQAKVLVAHHVRPADVGWVLPRCGDQLGYLDSGRFKLSNYVLEQMRPQELVGLAPYDPGEAERPPWTSPGGGWTDPVRGGRSEVVDLAPQRSQHPMLEERDVLKQLIANDDKEVVVEFGKILRGAQAALAAGQNGLAFEAAARILSVKATPDADVMFDHVQRTVAPAIALAASDDEPWSGTTAAMVLRGSPPGLSATAIARGAYLRDRRRTIETLGRVASTGPSRSRAHRMQTVSNEFARVSLGLDGKGKGVSAALTTESIAAITDLTRSVYSITLPKEKKTFPADAPGGLAGRAKVAPGWLIGAGGLSALGPADGKAIALNAFNLASNLMCPDLPLVGGDLFRFDWLLDEVRATVAQLEHLDVLLLGLIAQLADVIGDITEIANEAMDAVAKLVEQIRQQVDRIATEIQRTLGEILKAATSAAALLGVLKVVGDFKWEQWAAMFEVVVGAIGSGDNPITAVDNWIIGELSAGITQGLTPALAEFDAFVTSINDSLSEIIVPDTLLEQLTTLLATSDLLPISLTDQERLDRATEILAPIIAARDAAVATLTAEVTAARGTISELATTTVFSAELRLLVFAYLVTPLVVGLLAAAGVAIAGGPVGAVAVTVAISLLRLLGVEVIEWVIVGVLTDLTGILRNLQTTAKAGLAMAGGLLGQLRNLLSTMGGLEALLGSLTAKINQFAGMFPPEAAELQTAVLSARDAIRAQLTTLLVALDRSFFRETLSAVAQPGELTLPTPTRPAPSVPGTAADRLPDLGSLYGDLTIATQIASLLPRYEATRVAAQTLTGVRQSFTHILSLADVLGLPELTTAAGSTLQTLLTVGGKLPFSINPSLFDRVAPGIHGLLIKDMALHFDFLTPITDEQAMAALLGALGSAAGGSIDPALVARTAGFGMPGLPIIPVRVPSGVPAVLTSGCTSFVRLSPTLAAPLIPFLCEGDCEKAVPVSERPPSLAGVELLDDPNAGAQAAGWRMLAMHDQPQSLMFSHFELLSDGVRFIAEPKQLKPFELRGAIGSWELEIPAIVQQFVTHQLPPIRDVRLVFSTEGQWSSALAEVLTAPAAATEADQPLGELPATLDDLLSKVGDLLDATKLQTLVSLGGLQIPPVTTAGNVMIPIPLDSNESSSDTARVLLGQADAVFNVTLQTLEGMGFTPSKFLALREVRAGLLPSGVALDSSLGSVPVTVGYQAPSASAAVETTVNTTNGVASVPLNQISDPTSPMGTWNLMVETLPLPTTLTAAGLTLFVESLP